MANEVGGVGDPRDRGTRALAIVRGTWQWLLARAPFLLALGGIQYLILSTIAMMLYPGGTKYDPATPGYLFWNNMISDMGRTIAHDGTPNAPSCILFICAMITLAVIFIPFYIALSECLKTSARAKRPATAAAILGIGTAVLLALAAAFPQDLFPLLHLRLAQFSFVALAPSIIIYRWLVKGVRDFPRPCAPAFLVFAIIIITGIVVTIASGPGIDAVTVTIQATTQKIMVYSWNVLMPIEGWGLWKMKGRKAAEMPSFGR